MFLSKLAIKRESSNSKTTFANEKESFIIYSLLVRGLSSWSHSLARLQGDFPIADRTDQKNDIQSSNALWILASP